jgi:hypothetical protein
VLAIIAELAPVHAAAASHLADDDNVLAVERVPPVVHPTNIRPVVTVIGTCTTSADPTRREAYDLERTARRPGLRPASSQPEGEEAA